MNLFLNPEFYLVPNGCFAKKWLSYSLQPIDSSIKPNGILNDGTKWSFVRNYFWSILSSGAHVSHKVLIRWGWGNVLSVRFCCVISPHCSDDGTGDPGNNSVSRCRDLPNLLSEHRGKFKWQKSPEKRIEFWLRVVEGRNVKTICQNIVTASVKQIWKKSPLDYLS